MFRTSWKKPSYADKAAEGRQQAPGGSRPPGVRRGSATTRHGGGQQGVGGPSPTTDFVENGRRIRDGNIILRDERITNAAREKFLFNQRIKMEEKRTRLAKGNILNFLMDRKSVDDKRVLMNKVLRTAGFKCSDVYSIKLNDYRDSQAEVLLKEGIQWNLEEIEAKIKAAGFNVAVSSFDDKEEILNIFGLPLTNDIPEMKEKIREALEPFVSRVKDITATVYTGGPGADEEDFFGGLYDGNYKVKVNPLKDADVQIPNFVVIDKDKKVCAKAIYSKAINEKKNMCTNCYATDHFRDNVLCAGPKTWDVYAEEFEVAWREALAKKSDEMETEDQETESDVGRYSQMISDLKAQLSLQENRVSELETEVAVYKKGGPSSVSGEGEDDERANNNGEVQEVIEEEKDDAFVDADKSVVTVPAPGQDVPSDPMDPLSVDWSKEMQTEDLEKDNPYKRKDVSPLVGGIGKKTAKDEKDLRIFFDSLNLKTGKQLEFWAEGRKHTGKVLSFNFPSIKLLLDNKECKIVNLRHNASGVRLPTKASI